MVNSISSQASHFTPADAETLDTPLNKLLESFAGQMPMGLEGLINTIWDVELNLQIPPRVVLCHVYSDPSCMGTQTVHVDENEEEIQTWSDGRYVIKALAEYLYVLARRENPLPTILFAGGHSNIYKGLDICEIYADNLKKHLKNLGISGVEIIHEKQIREATEDYIGEATDTRGEVMFLKYMLVNNLVTHGRVLSVGRLPHMARIQRPLDENGVSANTLDIESMLAYFHPEAVRRLVSIYPHIISELKNFRRRDMVLLLFMKMFDHDGAGLEILSKWLGSNAKKRALDVLDRK